jgi:DNA replication protein DnaC
MTTEIDAFRSVNFVWTRQLKTIWRDQSYHVPSIHQKVLDDLAGYFLANTRDQDPDDEPLGRIIVGPAGLGKTHLMGELRRNV